MTLQAFELMLIVMLGVPWIIAQNEDLFHFTQEILYVN